MLVGFGRVFIGEVEEREDFFGVAGVAHLALPLFEELDLCRCSAAGSMAFVLSLDLDQIVLGLVADHEIDRLSDDVHGDAGNLAQLVDYLALVVVDPLCVPRCHGC